MSSSLPFEQLHGPLVLYLAPVGETFPDVDNAPAGNWAAFGATDGDQTVKLGGSLTFFHTNIHQGPSKAVLPEQMVTYDFSLVYLTLENIATMIADEADIVTAAGPPATKSLHLKRSYVPSEYALLARGEAMSPYGAFPGQYEIPRGVFDGEPEKVWTKAANVAMGMTFTALEDDTQSDLDDSLGRLIVQTA